MATKRSYGRENELRSWHVLINDCGHPNLVQVVAKDKLLSFIILRKKKWRSIASYPCIGLVASYAHCLCFVIQRRLHRNSPANCCPVRLPTCIHSMFDGRGTFVDRHGDIKTNRCHPDLFIAKYMKMRLCLHPRLWYICRRGKLIRLGVETYQQAACVNVAGHIEQYWGEAHHQCRALHYVYAQNKVKTYR